MLRDRDTQALLAGGRRPRPGWSDTYSVEALRYSAMTPDHPPPKDPPPKERVTKQKPKQKLTSAWAAVIAAVISATVTLAVAYFFRPQPETVVKHVPAASASPVRHL